MIEPSEAEVRRKTRRSFLTGGAMAVVGLAGWRWMLTRREEDGVPWPFRRVLETNEHLARDYFSNARWAKTYPRSQAKEPKANGSAGLEEDLDPAAWRLRVEGLPEDAETLTLSLDDIKRLPRTEMTTELRCVEGWSQVVHWAGARFSDFAAKYEADPEIPYVRLDTPDEEFYVGVEMESIMHPQTLLCYEMNGEPLTDEHGAPLRLVIPSKYGLKNIKRIGKIAFTQTRPADYWAERGYDWYVGL